MIPDAVLQAVARGWSCIPVKADKRPCLAWKTYQNRVPTNDELRRWFDEHNPRAWAVVTGAGSGLVVLDFDGEAGVETMKSLGLDPHVATPRGGFHVYLKHPGWPVRTLNHRSKPELQRRFPGTDIRADGGYAVFWGTANAGQYEWLRPFEPVSLEVLSNELREFLGLMRPPAPSGREARAQSSLPTAFLERALGRVRAEGRNNSGFWLACQLRDNHVAVSEAEVTLLEFQSQAPDIDTKGHKTTYTREEALASVRQAFSRAPRESQVALALGVVDEIGAQNPQKLPATDYGNAQRLVAAHGQDLRFSHHLGKWLVWDGRRWAVDETDEIMRHAKTTVRAIYPEAAKLSGPREREALAKHALASEREPRLRALVELARSEPEIPIKSSKLDSDPWLLNCLNGTIDLRTGELGAHRRQDLITKLVPVEYHPEARSPLWERVVREACGENTALEGFLQRSVGYSLTGDTREEKLFFIHGPAATSKSTILEAVKVVLGDYAVTSDFEALLRRRDVGGPRNDIARLAGFRFVVSVEVDEGRRIAEGLVKQLTGGDTVSARFLYHESFEFRPSCKLWLAANRAPQVRSDDDGSWRRILRIPFEHVIPPPDRDPGVKSTLRDLRVSGPAILTWAVRGCLDWQRDGLGVPREVERATQAYREDMDPLREFIEERCILHPSARVAAADLQRDYQEWAKESGERFTLNRTDFASCLRSHGCHQVKGTKGLRAWQGIALRDGSGEAWIQTGTNSNASPEPGRVAEGGTSPGEFVHEESASIEFPDDHATSRLSLASDEGDAYKCDSDINSRPESPSRPFGADSSAGEMPSPGEQR